MIDSQAIQKELEAALKAVQSLTPKFPRPLYAFVLGTGLGDLVSSLQISYEIPYQDIPFFPHSSVQSHAGKLVFGYFQEKPVVLMSGRVHGYEGFSPDRIAFPIRLMRMLGAQTLIITNAAGGLSRHHQCSDVMLIVDHINLMGFNPLTGPNLDFLGERFPDMSQVYDPALIDLAMEASLTARVALHRGVYAGVPGPSMETPAETRMLRILGADAVGMSTIPEVIAASHCGFRCLGISAITNVNRPDQMEPAPLETIIANAQAAGTKIHQILIHLFRLLP